MPLSAFIRESFFWKWTELNTEAHTWSACREGTVKGLSLNGTSISYIPPAEGSGIVLKEEAERLGEPEIMKDDGETALSGQDGPVARVSS